MTDKTEEQKMESAFADVERGRLARVANEPGWPKPPNTMADWHANQGWMIENLRQAAEAKPARGTDPTWDSPWAGRDVP